MARLWIQFSCSLATIALAHGALSSAQPIQGVSYGPVPLRSPHGGSTLDQDDWMSQAAKPMWGPRGRADLKVVKALGANMIRMYGNNPENDHTGFMDEAYGESLKVTPGMSDFPYFQMPDHGGCKYTDFDCYEQVKPLYTMNLERGFLTAGHQYHPAMGYMIVINEPDLKMPHTATIGDFTGVKQMCKTIISAFDAMLDAEKEVGVTGPLINFTVTFSFATCKSCERFPRDPALGQMWQLQDAMNNPERYGYTPRNDLAEAYRTRWTHSFNTANRATELQRLFFDDYTRTFTETPVFIGEYHSVHTDEATDLEEIMEKVRTNPVFLGISYFEYQVAYWKGGTEEEFGMFGLGDFEWAKMEYFGETYGVDCLVPVPGHHHSRLTQPQALARAYGGPYLDEKDLCRPSPESVPLTPEGFQTIAAQRDAQRMTAFVGRVVEHLGAVTAPGAAAPGTGVLDSVSEHFLSAGDPHAASAPTFEDLVVAVAEKPAWAAFDPEARCVADRRADAGQVGAAIGWACMNETLFNCSELVIPEQCANDTFATGDWFFSNFYAKVNVNPLQNCYFGGAAIFASRELYSKWGLPGGIKGTSYARGCVAHTNPPATPPPTAAPATPAPTPAPTTEPPAPAPLPGPGTGPPEAIKHYAQDCFGSCAGAGHCDDFCGRGNLCCRYGSWTDPPECIGVVFPVVGWHACVAPAAYHSIPWMAGEAPQLGLQGEQAVLGSEQPMVSGFPAVENRGASQAEPRKDVGPPPDPDTVLFLPVWAWFLISLAVFAALVAVVHFLCPMKRGGSRKDAPQTRGVRLRKSEETTPLTAAPAAQPAAMLPAEPATMPAAFPMVAPAVQYAAPVRTVYVRGAAAPAVHYPVATAPQVVYGP